MNPSRIDLNPNQRLAVTTQGRDLLVTAGAGTGKTTVLIERILYKLRHKLLASLDEILVVTFTEKAAQEMKDRLAREITQDLGLRPFLVQLPRAYLSTIDSFCGRLLRENFLAAECDPAFRVLDEHGGTEALEEALRRTFHEWYRQDQTPMGRRFRTLVEMTGYDDDGEVLKKLVRQLQIYARTTDDPDGYLERLLSNTTGDALEDLPWYEALGCLLANKDDRSEGAWGRALRLYGHAASLAQEAGLNTGRMRSLIETISGVSPADLLDPSLQEAMVRDLVQKGAASAEDGLSMLVPSAPRGAKVLPGFSLFHEAAKAAWRHFAIRSLPWKADRLLDDARDERRSVEVLVALVRETEERYSLYKRRNGFLDFADLEIKAARLLRRHGAELGLSTRFREVLVDEFQDVNPLQNEILSHLSGPEGRFRVGDVKQSIYQFRLADPGIFIEETRGREIAPAAGDSPLLVVLAENHRSRPPILRFTNHVFSSLFQDSDIGTSYDRQALVPGREEENPALPVELHLLEKKSGRSEGEDEEAAGALDTAAGNPDEPAIHWTAVQTEAYYAARRLLRLMEEERPLIPVSPTEIRPARWGDIAVLLRSQTNMDLFLEAFQDAGIPAMRWAGGSLLEEESVRDFRCLLSIIDNPRDDVALAAILRSPIFGLKDSQLLRIRLAWPQARSFLDAVAATAYADDPAAAAGIFLPAAADPSSLSVWTGPPAEDIEQLLPPSLRRTLREIMDRVRRWRLLHSDMELVQFLTALRAEAGIDAALLGRRGYARAQASLEKLLSVARTYEEERGPSLHGFLARISTLESAGGIEAVPTAADEESAVRILSIHKAKGLEFPIVVLPQLEWRFPRDRQGDKIRIGKKWAGIRLLDFEAWGQRDTAARQVLAELQEEQRRAEEARILYVALTRARERLILIGRPASTRWEDPLPQAQEARDLAAAQRRRQSRSALEWILATIPWEDREEVPRDFGQRAFSFSEIPLALFRVPLPEIARDLEPWIRARSPREGTSERTIPRTAPPKDLAPALHHLLRRLGKPCPSPPLDRLDDLKGKYWVTELESLADRQRRLDLAEEGSGVWLPAAAPGDGESAAAAAQRGVIYHSALAHLDLTRTSPQALDQQFAGFSRNSWWQGIPRDVQMEKGISGFFASDLGRALSSAAARSPAAMEREVTFSCKWPLRKLMAWLPGLATAVAADPRWKSSSWSAALDESWVLVQGRMDCLFRTEAGWILLDWKTDRVASGDLAARAAAYTPQVQLYREAVTRLWGNLAGCWLVFLHKGTAVEIPPP